ncbi:hypothetical protein EDD85DRAFT_789672 [Armillaria nabsnona]|nr:hypothetical protein EDD85DRAFT_789672 [Armillaria nabsnona]
MPDHMVRYIALSFHVEILILDMFLARDSQPAHTGMCPPTSPLDVEAIAKMMCAACSVYPSSPVLFYNYPILVATINNMAVDKAFGYDLKRIMSPMGDLSPPPIPTPLA